MLYVAYDRLRGATCRAYFGSAKEEEEEDYNVRVQERRH